MRTWIVGLLCVALAVFVAARYQDLKAEDIDAEVDALEHLVRAREEALDEQKRKEEEEEKEEGRELDLDNLTDEELQELLEALGDDDDDEDRRSLDNVQKPEKKGWIRRIVRRIRLPRVRIPRVPKPPGWPPGIPWPGKR